MRAQELAARVLVAPWARNSAGRKQATIAAIIVLAIWLAVTVFTASRHEFWRDEVRALSLARSAHSPLDLCRAVHYDGHPLVWYVLLYAGKSLVDTPLVLPVTSILIAFAAVAVFMFWAPFPFWARCIFIFSLPLYEYAVMARNYGISMLLMFVAARLFGRRTSKAVGLGIVVALLANTNAHSVVLAGLIIGIWAWDLFGSNETATGAKQDLQRSWFGLAVALLGILLSVISIWPRPDTIVRSAHQSPAGGFVGSLILAGLRPDQSFAELVPAALPRVLAIVLLYLPIIGLIQRPSLLLAAFAGALSFGALFQLVYPGAYRHQGLFLVFLLFLYWISMQHDMQSSAPKVRPVFFAAGYWALIGLLLWNVDKNVRAASGDIRFQASSSEAFGAFLQGSLAYRDAIIVPEPDFLLESLPYYARNLIYLPREHRFGTTASYRGPAEHRVSLNELLSDARQLHLRYARPALIVLGHLGLEPSGPGEKRYSFNKVFSWSTSDLTDLARDTVPVAEFNAAYTDENYKVYAVK